MKPFFKWPGGKRRLVAYVHEAFGGGRCWGHYHEPYLGGGAALLHLLSSGAVDVAHAYDIDADLLRLWRDLQEVPREIVNDLGNLPAGVPTRETYERVRAEFNESGGSGRMLWLLATCFNGAWRRNREGRMNQCKGDGAPNFRSDVVSELSKMIRDVSFAPISPEETGPGDWVYLDPPYPGAKGTYGHMYNPSFRAEAQAYADTGANVVVSLPPGDEADSFPGWRRVEIPYSYRTRPKGACPPTTEVILATGPVNGQG